MTLTDFLLARIAEDEKNCGGGDEPESWCDRATGVHYDPARVLAECEAKRQRIEHYARICEYADPDRHPANEYVLAKGAIERTLMFDATVYADHPDFRPEWRP